jgi:two-component system, cell cycle response regulator DivK
MSGSPAQILLIEDNADNRLLVTVLLEDRYRVVEAATAEEALMLLPAIAPDLFLIDITLPGMDGIELLAELRRLPASARVPAIAFTAHAMEGDRERFLAAGFDGYLSKPILEERLLHEAVTSALRAAERASGGPSTGISSGQGA